jgi:hypothetical protein
MSAVDRITPEPRRFSRRLPHWGWLMLTTVLLVLGFMGLSIWAPYHQEQQARARVRAMGGTVSVFSPRFNWVPGRLGDLVRKPFIRAGTIEFSGCRNVTDGSLRCLTEFPELAGLALSDTAITDAGLSYLAEFHNLEGLSIDGTMISDEGLRQIANMTNLKKLSMFRTGVSDGAVRNLRSRLPDCTIYR